MPETRETRSVELKRDVDLQDNAQKLKFLKEVVAMANADGGTIRIGVTDDGQEVGLPPGRVESFDPAKLHDLVRNYVEPDSVEIEMTVVTLPRDLAIVELEVPMAIRQPLVFSKSGQFVDENAKQRTAFPAHAVYVRRGTKAEPARWEDYRKWTDEAVTAAQSSFLDKVGLLASAPPDAEVRVTDGTRVNFPPRFLLEQSAALFEQRRDKLLSSDDLVYLWRNRKELDVEHVQRELLMQSALRKRATLFLWLWELQPTDTEVANLLNSALKMKDRDKSDAAKAILQTAAIFLDEEEYTSFVKQLSLSNYTHMRDAANDLSTPQTALDSVAKLRNSDFTMKDEAGLIELADLETKAQKPSARRSSAIGAELLCCFKEIF